MKLNLLAHQPSTAYTLLNTVANKKLYTPRQLEQADLANRLYALVGRPSYKDFLTMIRENQLKNCPAVSVEDAKRAVAIYGPDVHALRGKTVRTTPEHVPADQIRHLPLDILQAHGTVTICADLFHVDGLLFLATISRNLNFLTVQRLPSGHVLREILPGLDSVNNTYAPHGFTIAAMYADEEFSPLVNALYTLTGIRVNICATNEHVPEIERAIRTIKERNRATVSALPFKHYPKLLKTALIANAVTWLNSFPHGGGVSNVMSPRTLVSGDTIDFATHCRVPIGAYCEVHDEQKITNTELPRTHYAITLNPTGNFQGSYHFMSLTTGAQISRRRFTELPMTDAVIARVHDIARAEKNAVPIGQPEFAFAWAPGHPIYDVPLDDPVPPPPPHEGAHPGNDDENENENQDAADNNDVAHQNAPEQIPITSDEESDTEDEDNEPINEHINQNYAYQGQYDAFNDDDVANDNDEGHDNDNNLGDADQGAQLNANQDIDIAAKNDNDDINANAPGGVAHDIDPESETEDITPRYNLRGNKITYSHRFASQFTQIHEEAPPKRPRFDTANDLLNHTLATGFLFNQMSAKAGVKTFGDKAVNAIIQEYKQLDEKMAFNPIAKESLTLDDRKKALRSITLIKEKRCGRIKGRTVADGRPQRDYIPQEDSTSPTISIEALMLSIAIDANEKRHVATCDVEGAYLHADMTDTVHMVFEDNMVDYMVQANPDRYSPYYVTTNKHGKKLLYVELKKALYGCVKSALLWYNLFSSTLTEMGFTLNLMTHALQTRLSMANSARSVGMSTT